jgi:hypothetical protein
MTVDPPRIISRVEAKALGLKRFFTGKPCRHGHVAERLVTYACMECERVRARLHYAKNKVRILSERAAKRQAYNIVYQDPAPSRARRASIEIPGAIHSAPPISNQGAATQQSPSPRAQCRSGPEQAGGEPQ